jgi:glycosyltransferase involved in cell wall biosynthesis
MEEGSVFQKLDSETKTHVLYFISDKASIPYQRNLTLSHCLGTYLVFVDSDDYLLPGAFSLFDSCLEATPQAILSFLVTPQEKRIYCPRLILLGFTKVQARQSSLMLSPLATVMALLLRKNPFGQNCSVALL